MRRRFAAVAILAALACLAGAPAEAADTTVFAAASLKNALDDVTAAYLNQTGKSVTVSYGASSTLAKQIEQGAPADIFFSADTAWMDYLAERNLIAPETRRNLLGNEIVLVVPEGLDRDRDDRRQLRPRRDPRRRMAGWRWRTSIPCRPANTAKRR